jgi:hypothetical protein
MRPRALTLLHLSGYLALGAAKALCGGVRVGSGAARDSWYIPCFSADTGAGHVRQAFECEACELTAYNDAGIWRVWPAMARAQCGSDVLGGCGPCY